MGQIRGAFSDVTKLLVAEKILPGGPSYNKVQAGDILMKVNGEFVTDFIRLDEILDSNVGKSVELFLLRQGRKSR